MNNYDLSVQRFNQFAAEYSQRFMDLNAYSDSIRAIPEKFDAVMCSFCLHFYQKLIQQN